MAYITGSVFDSLGILPFSLAAGTQLTMSIQNNSNAPSYYGLETIPNNNGFYTSATPKNTSGSYISGSGISYITYDDYKMVAVVNPGGGTLVYTPSVAVSASTLWTKGTGASLLPATVASLLPGSYNQRVVNSGGYVESPDSITAAIAATPMLEDASFLYIPSGYASGVAFSELSTNDYGDLTWSRASDGTRTNSSGLVQRVPWNLLQYSEGFDFVSWSKTNATVTPNTTTAPNGTLTADTITSIGTDGRALQAVNINGNENYTFSVWLKSTTSSNINAAIRSVGNATSVVVTPEWQKFTITQSYPAAAPRFPGISGLAIGESIFAWGAQLVEGTSPQSYLPTTTRLNVPRLDYTYGTSPASLMEPQRTNLALYSQQFDDAYWLKSNVTVTTNQEISPDGTQNADLLSATGGATGFLYKSFTLTTGSSYTFSIYVKKKTVTGSSNRFRINFVDNLFVDFSSSVPVITGGSGSIVSSANSFYRIITTVTPAVASNILYIYPDGNNNSADEYYIYGAQLESGSYSSTYIPTTSTTVTRIVDAFDRNNLYTNGMVTSAGGTWYTEFRNNIAYKGDLGGDGIFLQNIGNTDSFRFYSDNSTTNRMYIFKKVSGSNTQLALTSTDTLKTAIKWNGSTADVFINGTKVVSATSFTATQLEEFDTNIVASPKYIQAMALFNQPLAGVDMGVLTGASYYPSFLNMAQANNYTIA